MNTPTQAIFCFFIALLFASAGSAREYTRDGIRFSIAPEPSWIEKRTPLEIPAAKAGATDAQYGWIDSQINRRIVPAQSYVFWSVRADSESALDDLGQVPFEFSRDFETLEIHFVRVCRAGRCDDRLRGEDVTVARRETELSNNMLNGRATALVLVKDLRVGDVIEVAATWSGENPLLAGLVNESFRFGSARTTAKRRVRVLYPKGEVVYRSSAGLKPDLITSPAGTEARLQASELAAVRYEDRTPVEVRTEPFVEFGTKRTWADVAIWAAALYPSDAPIPVGLNTELGTWRKLDDPLARAERALRFVQDEIRYFGVFLGDSSHRPNLPEKVLDSRYGDCKDKSLLLVSLLRELNINAVPALVSTARQGGIADSLPGADVFDHVIVSFEYGGRRFFIDPTLSHERGAITQQAALPYGKALLVRAGSTGLIDIPLEPQPITLMDVNERFLLRGAGYEVETISRALGPLAIGWRSAIASNGLDELADRYLQYQIKRFGAATRIGEVKVAEDPTSGALEISERYLIPNVVAERMGESRLVDLPAYAIAESLTLPSTFERKQPLYSMARGNYRHHIEFELKAGESAGLSEPEIRIDEPEFRFTRTFTQNSKRVELTQELKNETEVVSAARSKAYLAKLKQVSEALGPRLVVEGGPGGEVKRTREERLRALLGEDQ